MKSAGLPLCVALSLTISLSAPRLYAQPLLPTAKPPALLPEISPTVEDPLHKVAQQYAKAILLVGYPDKGHGTAWVVSRQHRLLVTNAHVADIMHAEPRGKLVAIVNGQSQPYRVEKAWYHPGLRRVNHKLGVSTLSADPASGDVDANSPDIAVLELAADGPDLEAELPLATPQELEKLWARPVGMSGFPGHDTKSWPRIGDNTQATFHSGVVSRLTDFRFSENAPLDRRQYVQHTATSWPGFSGSPVFLSNGHVVAVHNSGHRAKNGDVVIRIPYGIRVDCLWELLVDRGLDDKVPGIERALVNPDHWKPDQRDQDLQQAIKLVREAAALDADLKFSAAVEKCVEAIRLAPDYPWSYHVRGSAQLNNYFFDTQAPAKLRAERLVGALNDAIAYARMLGAADPESLLSLGAVLANFGDFETTYRVDTSKLMEKLQGIVKGDDMNRAAFSLLDQLLASTRLSTEQRARAYSFRGTVRNNVGSTNAGLEDHNQAIRLDPNNDMLLENRAAVYASLGLNKKAQADRDAAEKIRQRKRSLQPVDRET